MNIIVSACLAGVNCRWDSDSRPTKEVIKLIKGEKAIPLCPEQLGSLSTPRVPAEQKGRKVFTKDVTAVFQRGAREALEIAHPVSCKKAILKSKSPSCGSNKIYDGTFS